jgi:hypothetical protein
MKTLAAIVPNKAERMGRRFLRDMLLGAIARGDHGIGWQRYPTFADALIFTQSGEVRQRWIEFPGRDDFIRRFPEEAQSCESPEEIDATIAGRRLVCTSIFAEVRQLLDAPLDDPTANCGEFLFQFADVSLPVSVHHQREGEIERLELHFTATPDHHETAHRIADWRLEHPPFMAPLAQDEPAAKASAEPPQPRPSMFQRAVSIFMVLLTAAFTILAAFEYPLLSLCAFSWGFFILPLWLWLIDRPPIPGKPNEQASAWIIMAVFIGLFAFPAVFGALILRTFDGLKLFFPTLAGIPVFAFAMYFRHRNHRAPELEPL